MGGQIRRGRIWRFLGRPNFQSRGPQIPIFKGFGDLWTENRGPKNAKSYHNGSDPPFAALWMVLVSVPVSLLVVFVFFLSVGASASDSPSSFLSFSSILSSFFSSCCLSSFFGCMFSCSCVCVCVFSPPLASFASLVFPYLYHLCYYCLLFLSFLLLCMYLVWLFLLLWFLSLSFLFLTLRFFFAPGPHAHLNRKTMK